VQAWLETQTDESNEKWRVSVVLEGQWLETVIEAGWYLHPMMNKFIDPCKVIQQSLHEAVLALVPGADVSKLIVKPSSKPQYGDYQAGPLIAFAQAHHLDPGKFVKDVQSILNKPRD